MEQIYNNPISVTSQFYFCPVPLRLDTYSGCAHNCVYCFANTSQQKYIGSKDFTGYSTKIKRAVLGQIQEYLDVAFHNRKNTFKNQELLAIEYLKRNVPIHFGGMSDPLQPIEEDYEITYYTLKLLAKYDYPVILSTKGKLLLTEKYLKLIKEYKNIAIQISLIDDRQRVLNELEPDASLVQERFLMFEELEKKWTACRIQPLIPKLSEARLESLIHKLKLYNVNHIMIEGLKFFSGNKLANKKISNAFKVVSGKEFDLAGFYKSIGAKTSGNDLELPTWYKYQYIKKAKKVTEELGMTLGVADNDLRFMSSESVNPCCCGVNNLKGFENVMKHNTGYAIKYAMEKKCKITYDLIENEFQPDGTFRFIGSKEKLKKKFGKDATYKTASKRLKKSFIEEWDKGGKNSPLQQFIVKSCEGKDKHQIYDFISDGKFKELMEKKAFKQSNLSDLSKYLNK